MPHETASLGRIGRPVKRLVCLGSMGRSMTGAWPSRRPAGSLGMGLGAWEGDEERGEERGSVRLVRKPNLKPCFGGQVGRRHRRRTRHPGAVEVELLHLGRELELRHIAWEGGGGGVRGMR